MLKEHNIIWVLFDKGFKQTFFLITEQTKAPPKRDRELAQNGDSDG